jgi:hypothetical protein
MCKDNWVGKWTEEMCVDKWVGKVEKWTDNWVGNMDQGNAYGSQLGG